MKRIYYGWAVVAAAMMIFMLVMGLTFGMYGLFVVPVSEEFKLSRANANSGLIILNLGIAVLSPFLGRLLDRLSVRRLMMLSSVMFMAGFAVLSQSRSLWLNVAILALLLPFACKGAGTLTAPLLVVRWFTIQRGRAMAIAQLGLSLGSLVLPPIVGALMERYGWRTTLMITGVGGGVLLLLIAATIRDRPGPNDRETADAPPPATASQAGATPGSGPLPIRAILGSPQFWTINLSCGVAAAISSALLITLAPLAREQGLSIMQAASLMSAMSACGIAAKLVLAVVGDRVDRIVLLTVMFLLGAVVNGALAVSDSYLQLLIAAGSLGLIGSAVTPIQYALIADRFGAPSFGTVTGLTVPLVACLGVLSMRYAGEVFDRTGGYDLLFLTFVLFQIIAAFAIFATRFAGKAPVLATS